MSDGPTDLTDDDIIRQRRIKRQKLFESLNSQKLQDSNLSQSDTIHPVNDEIKLPISESDKVIEQTANITKDDGSDSEDDMFADEKSDSEAQNGKIQERLDEYHKGQKLDASLLDNWDDVEGYYRAIPGELLNNKYRVKEVLGKGMFASVVRAADTSKESGTTVAIKVIRNNESMKRAGQKEISILKELNRKGSCIVQLLSSFTDKGHLCLVFENLEGNLREMLKRYRNDHVKLDVIQQYAKQLFKGLLRLKECRVVHADLKPDNILVNSTHSVMKIADLGSAIKFSDENEPTSQDLAPYMASRFYRAPELILGLMPYDYALDTWAIGCTLYELFTGQVLFPGKNNNNMLRIIMDVQGKFSHKMLRRSQLVNEHFNDELDFMEPVTDKITGKTSTKVIKLPLSPRDSLKSKVLSFGQQVGESQARLDQFYDLLSKMLVLNPVKRLTPEKGLQHPFVTGESTSI